MELRINCTYRLVKRTLLTRNGRSLSDDSLETTNTNAAQSCKRIEKGTQQRKISLLMLLDFGILSIISLIHLYMKELDVYYDYA